MVFALPTDLAIFLLGTFAAAFVAGLAGFAFGMVAAAVWLHALPPAQAAALVVAYALLVQGYAAWRLRHAISLRRLLPLVLGSAAGIPAGLAVLEWTPAAHLRAAVGALLVLFSSYNLVRPRLPEARRAGSAADAGVGVLNGVLAGATGLGGILPTIWSGLRGWTRDEQRAVFQPTAAATFLMTLLAFGGAGLATSDAVRLFLVGLPALAAGTLLGWALYGRLDETAFRRVVLVLLLVSGISLAVTGR
jgi:uncharacterized protein